jgi:hypothetical protein
MRKLPASIVVSVLVAGLNMPALLQAEGKTQVDKSGTSTTKNGHVKEMTPATKAMEKASSPKETGVPDSGDGGTFSQDARPATKAMDKAAPVINY